MAQFLWLGEGSPGMLAACHRLLHGDQCLLHELLQLFFHDLVEAFYLSLGFGMPWSEFFVYEPHFCFKLFEVF